ncbi:MAG: hypothetical protein HOJ35_04855 [Bdellovibrionales bacterium]|nr:hypothetical protein [Bdellovibrionales bacterium]
MIFSKIKNIFSEINQLDPSSKKNILFVGLSIFSILFSYPIVRSTTTAIFLDSFGAKSSPLVWLLSVIILSFVIGIFSRWQTRLSIHKLYFYTSIFSFVFFLLGIIIYISGFKHFAYLLFVWKEAYIVLLLHMVLGYFNTSINVSQAKVLYGPLGAVGSIGGILGGLCTTQLTFLFSSTVILPIGGLFILISGLFFVNTDRSICLSKNLDSEEKMTPLKSIKEIKKYVFWFAIIIALSQFTISIANFKFNLLFDEIVTDKLLKVRYLGKLYSAVNLTSLIIQILFIPICYKYIKNKHVHFFLPLFYLFMTIIGFTLGGNFLLPVASTFVLFKGLDYSLLNVAKELIYFPLNNFQKYGAKYLCDILVYRSSKGMVSFLLIFFQSDKIIMTALYIFLGLWFLSVFPLFSEQKKLVG